ncbi:U3 small nucleolar RNA-associated protein 4 homolog [Lissotriton helveticus]
MLSIYDPYPDLGMGEFKVHRVRFFDYLPSGIRCVAYNVPLDRLAVSRNDGSVEIYNFSANYFQEKVFPGDETRSTEAICWAAGSRLFTAGLDGKILEYGLENLCIKYSLDGFGGPIWGIAANPSGSHLAIGCEDGSVKLFQILPDKIQFEKSFDRQKDRILSLSWLPSGTHIAAGSIDAIRIFDVKSGHAVQRILVDRNRATSHNRECLVWSLAFLSNGEIVSADSTGKVQFWDWEKGTLIRTFPVSNVDVLSLALAPSEDSFVVGTAEGTVFQYQLLPVRNGEKECHWVRTKTFKYHTHDVRSVAHSATALISGGLDANLVIRPLMEKVQSKNYDAALRKITFPHRRLVCCAKKAQLLLFQYPDRLELWRLGTTEAQGKHGDILPVSRSQEHLLQLKRKGSENISCSAISPCGSWISYATASRFCLYRLQHGSDNIGITRVPKVLKQRQTVHQIIFSACSSNIFVASAGGSVHMVKLSDAGCKLVHTFTPKSGTTDAVYLLSTSTDGKWLVTAHQNCEIHIYNIPKLKHYCTVPSYDYPASALAIQAVTNNLVIAHSDQQVFEFSIEEKQYTDWSRKMQQHGLHKDWLERDTPITNITFNPKKQTQILLHDTYMLCILDKSLPLPDDKTMLQNQMSLRSLSESARKASAHAFKISKAYQPLLFMDLLDKGTLVVVERPLEHILAQLPAPIRQKKFGT